MVALALLVFGSVFVAGVVGLALLVKALDVRGARRNTAALLAGDEVEDELQAMIAAARMRASRTS
jgi:hypothetical protein